MCLYIVLKHACPHLGTLLWCFPYKAISLHGISRQWWVISEPAMTICIYYLDILGKYMHVNYSDTMATCRWLKPKCVNLSI